MTPADTSVGAVVLWVAAFSTLVSFASVIWTIFSGGDVIDALFLPFPPLDFDEPT
jgi:hypothetical protein